MPENFSLREAADFLGISIKAIRHRIKVRNLHPLTAEGPNGLLYLLTPEQIEVLRTPVERGGVYREGPSVQQETLSGQPPGTTGIPIEVHDRALSLLQQLNSERSYSEQRATAAERQLLELQMQVGHYQKALSEHAESLHQVRAEGITEGYRQQAEENERQMLLWENEKSQLLEDIQLQRKRVQWLEQRVPRWVRKMFGAM